MTRMYGLVDAHKYTASVLYVGLVLVGTIYGLRALGYEPRTLLGIANPAHATAAPAAHVSVPAAHSPAAVTAAVTASTVWPLHGTITNTFGAPDPPYQRFHTGIDISSGRPAGASQVVAFRAGQVVGPGNSFGGYGNIIAVDHGGGLVSYYGHLATISVATGQYVQAGEVIGREGDTGDSTGTHLHFEIRLNGSPVNPMNYLPANQ